MADFEMQLLRDSARVALWSCKAKADPHGLWCGVLHAHLVSTGLGEKVKLTGSFARAGQKQSTGHPAAALKCPHGRTG
jgi:hypothetical protein